MPQHAVTLKFTVRVAAWLSDINIALMCKLRKVQRSRAQCCLQRLKTGKFVPAIYSNSGVGIDVRQSEPYQTCDHGPQYRG